MSFIVQLEDGTEAGPFNEKQLLQQAENGEITSKTQMRSKFIVNWKDAKDLPCLEAFFKKQAAAPPPLPGLMALMKEGLVEDDSQQKLNQTSTTFSLQFTFKPVSIFSRAMATLIDLTIIGTFLLVLFLLTKRILPLEMLTHKVTLYLSFFVTFLTVLVYYFWTIGLSAQTYGQRFFGIMIVRAKNGEPVLLIRAYFYTLLMFLFGWLTPFFSFITPNNRSVHDVLTGCRAILVKGARK